MEALVLGCGTSTGVPLPGCPCEVCQSINPKDRRFKSSLLIKHHGKNILIDTSTDLRHQALSHNIKSIQAVIYTHSHADHILGLEDLRAFNFTGSSIIPLYGTQKTFTDLERCFHYIFEPTQEYKGGLLAQISKNIITSTEEFIVEGIPITPILLYHGEMEVLGFRVNDFAYCTDCNKIPESSLEKMKNLETLIIDGLRFEPHFTHFTIGEALNVIEFLKPKKAYLTHMSHTILYDRDSKKLPENVFFSYDGLHIPIF